MRFEVEKGRWVIRMDCVPAGDDLVIVLQGGEGHVGCVLLGHPRPSLKGDGTVSSTISTLNVIGHKDDEAARPFLHRLVRTLGKTISLTCGLHLDDVTPGEIEQVGEALDALSERLMEHYAQTNDDGKGKPE